MSYSTAQLQYLGRAVRNTSRRFSLLDTSAPMRQPPRCIDFPRIYNTRPNLILLHQTLTIITLPPNFLRDVNPSSCHSAMITRP